MEYILKRGQIALKQDPLIYGKHYKLWRNGVFIGIAMFVHDKFHGDVFLKEEIIKGKSAFSVFAADEWEIVVGA
jgi:hypothetical protein